MMTRGTGARCCETPPGVNHGLPAAITELGSLLRPALGSHATGQAQVADLVGTRAGPAHAEKLREYRRTARTPPCPIIPSAIVPPEREAGQGLEDKVVIGEIFMCHRDGLPGRQTTAPTNPSDPNPVQA